MKILLTIDDAPSKYLKQKVDFLKSLSIPAIFYVRGEFIDIYEDHVVHAIKNGFLIGNHSYSHPHFSKISIDECLEEIIKTERLIEECYKQSGIKRPCKLMRFPFADRGAGDEAVPAKTLFDQDKVQKLQNFLREKEFSHFVFGRQKGDFIDSYWDWDTQDYKPRLIQNSEEYKKELIEFYEKSSMQDIVMLLHDFDRNHHLFDVTMEFLLSKKVDFANPEEMIVNPL